MLFLENIYVFDIVISFRSHHKFESKSGYPTFWNHIVDSVKFQDDHLKVPEVTQAY